MTEFPAMQSVDALPPLDSKALNFDIARETRRTIVDMMRGEKPTTILGMLLANPRKGVTLEFMAERLKNPIGQVNWNVEKLEAEELCVRVGMKNGNIKILPIAPYTARNE